MRIKERSCGLSKENLKFTIGARNYKNYTAIGGRTALDAEVVCGVFDEKGFPIGPIVRSKPISNSQYH
jgi:hypothetical protein